MSSYTLDHQSLRVTNAAPSQMVSHQQFWESRQEEYLQLPQNILSKDFMSLFSFDKEMEWRLYFPENNVSQVLSVYAKIVDKRLAERKRQRRRRTIQQSQKIKQIMANIQTKNNGKVAWNHRHKSNLSNKPHQHPNSIRDS